MKTPAPKARIALALALAFVLGAACLACGTGQGFLSGNVCGVAQSAYDAVQNLSAACTAGDPASAGATPPACFDVASCNDNLAHCTGADAQVLAAIAACQNTYASNQDCSQSARDALDTCASAAGTAPDGGDALSPMCAQTFLQNEGACGTDAGS